MRLCDVKAAVRITAAQTVARATPLDGPDVLAAALFPSTTVYYVAESALPLWLDVVEMAA